MPVTTRSGLALTGLGVIACLALGAVASSRLPDALDVDEYEARLGRLQAQLETLDQGLSETLSMASEAAAQADRLESRNEELAATLNEQKDEIRRLQRGIEQLET